jgi:hypothetical protein
MWAALLTIPFIKKWVSILRGTEAFHPQDAIVILEFLLLIPFAESVMVR